MLEPLRQLYSIPSMGYARKTVAVILDSLRGVCSKNRANYTQFTEWGMLEPLLQLPDSLRGLCSNHYTDDNVWKDVDSY